MQTIKVHLNNRFNIIPCQKNKVAKEHLPIEDMSGFSCTTAFGSGTYCWRWEPNVMICHATFSNSLIIQKPKTKEIMHCDVFGYLMKNSSFLHP